jgi:hypothetical protein
MFTEDMYVSLSHICPNIQEISTPTKHTNLINGKYKSLNKHSYFVNPPMAKLANS